MTVVRWRCADEPVAVHRLIEASDRAVAERRGGAPPQRSFSSTSALVSQGWVQVGEDAQRIVATITISPHPTFNADLVGLPPAARPWYQQRLALDPGSTDPLAGARAVRRAIEIATAGGGDVLRAEANPDLQEVLRMLEALGFRVHAEDRTGPRPRAFLERSLAGRAGAGRPAS